MKDISFSPQCLGLALPENKTSGCKNGMDWRPDMDPKELALCMGRFEAKVGGGWGLIRLELWSWNIFNCSGKSKKRFLSMLKARGSIMI